MSAHVCIGTKRGQRGVVWDSEGKVLGRAVKHARVAASMKGGKGEFYTANVYDAAGNYTGPSLGTRHKTRASAVRAIRMFWGWYLREGYQLPSTRTWDPMGTHVDVYKRQHPEVCALPTSKGVA